MKKILKDYYVLIFSLVLAIAITIYDLNYYWPVSLDWVEGHVWYLLLPLCLPIALNLYFPLLDNKKRTPILLYRELTNTPARKKKFFVIYGGFVSFVVVAIWLSLFSKWAEQKNEASVKHVAQPTQARKEVKAKQEVVEVPEVITAPIFRERDPSPIRPDVVVLTKNLAELPKDIVKNSFLGKIITKETMFYYEDDPQYLGLIGTLRRLSYEHKVEFEDNVVKYILSMPAEIALWKGSDGKIKNFLLVAEKKSLNKRILSFYLQLKKMRADNKVRTFIYEGEEGFYIKVQNKEIAIWNNKNKLYITDLHPKYFPDKNEDNLKEHIGKLGITDNKKGFYERLYGVELKSKHSLILNSTFLSFGYDYFIPSLKAIRFDFEENKWGVLSLVKGDEKFKSATTTNLWKVFPKSTAMCIGLPVDGQRVSDILEKYKEMTLERLEAEKIELEKSKAKAKAAESSKDVKEGDDTTVKEVATVDEVENKNENRDVDQKLFSIKEVEDFVKNVVAVCWYESSTIFTPLFITEVTGGEEIKPKLSFLFDKFIGGLEKNYNYKTMKEKTQNGVTEFSRIVSSKYGLKNSDDSSDEGLRFKKYFNVKLAFNNEYLIFSPDDRLVDLAVSTLNKNNPSVYDELKISNKNISYLLNPYGLSQLLDKYMDEALPRGQESMFRKAIKGHLSSAFEKLSNFSPFGIDMPNSNNENALRWEKLKIHDL